ncbi:MAG: hypothetical protein Kow009_13790 [Spirochaetales bacterium]
MKHANPAGTRIEKEGAMELRRSGMASRLSRGSRTASRIFHRSNLLALVGILLLLGMPMASHGLEAGVVLGPGVGWVGGSDWKDDLSAEGMEDGNTSEFLYGAFLRVPLFHWKGVSFRLRPEVQLMRPGGSGSSSTADMDVSAKVLHFPLGFEAWYPLPFGAVYGFVGPSINLFLTEIEYRYESTDTNTVETGSNTPYYGVVVGALAGMGYAFPITTFSIQMELRFTHTISLVLKDKDATFGGLYFLLGAFVPVRG